jgi:hypothetical protein
MHARAGVPSRCQEGLTQTGPALGFPVSSLSHLSILRPTPNNTTTTTTTAAAAAAAAAATTAPAPVLAPAPAPVPAAHTHARCRAPAHHHLPRPAEHARPPSQPPLRSLPRHAIAGYPTYSFFHLPACLRPKRLHLSLRPASRPRHSFVSSALTNPPSLRDLRLRPATTHPAHPKPHCARLRPRHLHRHRLLLSKPRHAIDTLAAEKKHAAATPGRAAVSAPAGCRKGVVLCQAFSS